MKFNKNQLFKLKKALLQLGEVQTEEGVTLITDGDIGVGVEVFVNGDEGLTPATDGTYNSDGKIITVESGIITNIGEKVEETTQVIEETTEEEPVQEETTQVEEEIVEEIKEEVSNEEVIDVEALKARIKELEALVEELNKKMLEPVAEPVEEAMKKQEKTSKKQEMNYLAAIKKAREINRK